MAADALKEKAKEMGVDIKVETNGSGGIKHALTAKKKLKKHQPSLWQRTSK
ncbi:hypothetical protein BsIDN1_25730 [Bacillus safensis]|uniref:Uncharacterized protein n=1 Tax=Bacillus safensis TaxID=561879 RepID=A0A5S9M7X9_BACIA|nr:hypothetical protein BsIDN1_25730 [Bacillus safensis]